MLKKSRGNSKQLSRSELELLTSPDFILRELLRVDSQIRTLIRTNAEAAFIRAKVGQKLMTTVDMMAETSFIVNIEKKFKGRVRVIGEESLERSPILTGRTETFILVDIIDGTDLLEKDLGNWCSAVVIFTPSQNRIDGAYVAVRGCSENVFYFAVGNQVGKRPFNSVKAESESLQGVDDRVEALDATVCMYGQKAFGVRNCLLHLDRPSILPFLESVETENKVRKSRTEEVGFRFFNLAGNPMMVRLADGQGIHCVMDVCGQAPHDVVPGALIAMSAGAKLFDARSLMSDSAAAPRGLTELNSDDLVRLLYEPNSTKMKYILAANKKIAEAMAQFLSCAPLSLPL